MTYQEKYDERRIRNFRTKVGPKVRDYLAEAGPGTIVGIPTAGRLFAIKLYEFLLTPGIHDPHVDVKYIEAEKDNIKRALTTYRPDVENRHLIIVDDDIHTKQTYDEIRTQLQECINEFRIPEIKWAVEYDGPGVADWSVNRNPVGNHSFMEEKRQKMYTLVDGLKKVVIEYDSRECARV